MNPRPRLTLSQPMTPEPTARWSEYATERRLFCGPRPDGHHIPNTYDIPEFGFIRCNHRIGNEKRECGRWVFAYVIRGGKVVVAEVTLDEKDEMKKLVTPAQMVDYLGIMDRLAG